MATDFLLAEVFTSQQWFVVVIVAIGCGTGILLGLAGIFAGLASSLHRRVAENELKREMLDRGMTADEIKQVIESTPPIDFLDRMATQWKKRHR